MINTANSLTLASVIVLLLGAPTVALSGSNDCAPSDPAALHACFHSAEFNFGDGLDVYTRDLSAHGTPRPTSGKSAEAPVAVKSIKGIPVHASVAPQLEPVALRAFFHSATFNVGDGLTVYDRDYSSQGSPWPVSHAQKLVQLPQSSH